MPTLPVSQLNDVAIQNNTTGQVDYLQFQGSTLIQSDLVDYGLGVGWNIVGSDFTGPGGPLNLVAQNSTSGAVDFLGLDSAGHLVSSLMSSAVPPIIGDGYFGNALVGQEQLISQLPDGQLDFLEFNSAGTLIASDLVANSIGLPHAVGAALANEGMPALEAFSGVGANPNAMNVVTQLADGSLDVIGFSGEFAAGTLSFSNSYLLPGSAGSAPVGALNPDIGALDQNIADGAGHQGVQMVSQLANGQLDFLSFDSGYNSPTEGAFYASDLLTQPFAGWHAIDASAVVTDLFPT
jgi:hypothetical protein